MLKVCNLLLLAILFGGKGACIDALHYSQVFHETRDYRIFLPRDYERNLEKRYPVVYFFHGFGERFNKPSEEVGDYDFGYNGDNLSSYAASHDVIIVRPDGYNPRYPGDTRKRPYNECPFDASPADCTPGDTHRDFAEYFLELVGYVDAHYRTLADRTHRGVSGVSIGGWMAYFLAWKYPDRIGSASNFMGSSEFVMGGKGFATEWSPTYQYANYEGMYTRLVIGSQDFIRWYHREMQKIWQPARTHHEVEVFPSTHGTPGMAKTLDFHMRAFENPLPKPSPWTHADLYPSFQVWGYSVQCPGKGEGFVTLADVSPSGFRASGPAAMQIQTDALYRQHIRYWIGETDLTTGRTRRYSRQSDGAGRLTFSLGAGNYYVFISEKRSDIGTVVPGLKPPAVPGGPPIDGVSIADGVRRTVWRHAIERAEASMGEGNGDGVANPGESIVFQLLDRDAYRGGEVVAWHPCLEPLAPIRDQWGSYDHVGATQKYSVLRVSDRCPTGRNISVSLRFVLPNKPEHVLREGVFEFRISDPPKRQAAR